MNNFSDIKDLGKYLGKYTSTSGAIRVERSTLDTVAVCRLLLTFDL